MPELLQIIGVVFHAPVILLAIRIAWILFTAYVILRLVDSALNRLRLIVPSADVVARVEQRTETLRHIVRGVVKGVLVLVVAFEIGAELGYNLGPVLASAGIVGLAVGFGAQSLVKDFISGFFI